MTSACIWNCYSPRSFGYGSIIKCINTLRPRQNSRHFPDDILKWIFLNKNIWISITISLKFVSEGSIKISQHWFGKWLVADQATSHYLNQWCLIYWRIYASLGLNVLKMNEYKMAANSTCRSSIGEFHVSHPNGVDQLHFPPGVLVISVRDRTGGVSHMIPVHSFTCCVACVCAALGGRAEQGKILAWWKNRNNKRKYYCGKWIKV